MIYSAQSRVGHGRIHPYGPESVVLLVSLGWLSNLACTSSDTTQGERRAAALSLPDSASDAPNAGAEEVASTRAEYARSAQTLFHERLASLRSTASENQGVKTAHFSLFLLVRSRS